MSKDNKLTKDTKIPDADVKDIGGSPMSQNINKSLATFRDIADLAVKNSQAENIINNTNNVSENINKGSRQTNSITLMGLGKLKQLKGFKQTRKA
jgi:2,3-bisphosphoglycerate-independent phosphoglycerate mutase|tara:strand:+ start:27224 stop:27508 length:285 start_codon:yes stop_codon:yes gene_type:complete